MCTHVYETLAPVYDETGNIEAATGILCCSLLDDAEFVLNGVGEYYGHVLDLQPDGWHRLVWLYPQEDPKPVSVYDYDEDIPF